MKGVMDSKTWLLALCLAPSLALGEAWPIPDWQTEPTALDWRPVTDYAFAAHGGADALTTDALTTDALSTDALLIVRDGRILFERYRAPTTASTAHLTWSVSKSVLATLLGVAWGQGRFALDDPAARYYPPLQARHGQVRLQDLLHWASGLDWQEDYEYAPLYSSVIAMLYTRGHADMAGYVAARPAAAAPGQRFVYFSGDSNLLAAVLERMLPPGQSVDYPWDALFEPLGITSAVWERDAAGTLVGSSYLYLSARDLARIGLLMLREGRWQTGQVLPAQWVAFNRTPFAAVMTAPQATIAGDATAGEPLPGGHWWLNQAPDGAERPWPHAPADTYAALGHWGQALYLVPSQRLLIVRYGNDRGTALDHDQLLQRVLAVLAGAGA